jgi:(p)ppGpp synthase/HD superfamily hydrolase
MTRLTQRFQQALALATRLHAGQYRKETETPYVAHLLAVCSLVLENGGDEEQAIAALLHDAIEDQGDKISLEEIRSQFGVRVAEIVRGCTDAMTRPKPPWQGRKEAYVAHLGQAPADELLVATADKLHNARTILADYRTDGEQVWERFTGGRQGSLWYYRALVQALRDAGGPPLVEELDRVVTELERLVARGEPSSPQEGNRV